MKTKSIATALSLALLASGAAHAATSYPMLCRGGPAMRIMEAHDVSSAGVPGATAMWVYFNAAGAPGSVQPPNPGECTWIDRTIGADEPKVLWMKAPDVEFAFQVMGSGQIVSDATGPRLNVEGASLSPVARDWDSVVRGVMTGASFTVQVYNSGGPSPVMVVTHVGP